MRIAVDVMGGDRGPKVIVEGAIQAAREFGVQLVLVGDQRVIADELSQFDLSGLDIGIKHASEVVEMNEPPTVAIRKKRDSSIRVSTELVKSGEAEAVVSAGNTGAAMATAKILLGALRGVERPAIATILPTAKDIALLLDAGANVDCKPRHLLQFAIMGYTYSKDILGVKNPRVGLLNIGEEESKGNELTKESFKTLKEGGLNFIGNVEGKDLYSGNVDVVVCDGFTGNVALKISESVAEMISSYFKQEIPKKFLWRLGYLLMKPCFQGFKKKVDYDEYGGAPLLGINGVCIICHGRSGAKAIKNAIKVAIGFIQQNVNSHIQNSLAFPHKEFDHSEKVVGEN
ncbi:MAG: phosphate acyltransferase PlsX [bacterium]|nr:phosphate acyltransferase PlsX [bacterium]